MYCIYFNAVATKTHFNYNINCNNLLYTGFKIWENEVCKTCICEKLFCKNLFAKIVCEILA